MSIPRFASLSAAVAVLALVALCPAASAAPGDDDEVQTGTRYRLLGQAEASRLLGTTDAFVDAMSPVDRALFAARSIPTSREEYLACAASSARAWDSASERLVRHAMEEARTQLGRLTIPLPPELLLIRSAPEHMLGAPYTRRNAIVLQDHLLRSDVLVHEIFHVALRHAPALRRDSRRARGALDCTTIKLPAGVASRRVTNPDACVDDVVVQVSRHGKKIAVLPVLLLATVDIGANGLPNLWRSGRGGAWEVPSPADHLRPYLLRLEGGPGSWRPARDGFGSPILHEPSHVPEFAYRTDLNHFQPDEDLVEHCRAASQGWMAPGDPVGVLLGARQEASTAAALLPSWR